MKPEITRLPNGFTIVSLDMPDIATAAVGINADVGARHEAANENGLAHLFEHMVFKGTERRSARAIAEEIENVGGSLNAWTSRDTTVFHARTLGEDLPLAVDLLSDLVNAPRFDAEDLDKEKQVVLSEIGEATDTPDDVVFDHLQWAAYPEQSIGRPILGTETTLAGLDRPSLTGWRDRLYHGSNIVLSAAGRVDHDALARQAEELFGRLPPAPPPSPDAARWTGGQRLETRRAEQLHIAIAHEAPSILAPDYFAAQLFAMALGGGMSSRLFQEVREEHGLAYSVSASHGAYADSGMLTLYLATRPKDAKRALAMVRSIGRDAAAALEQVELDRARAQLKAGTLMALEGCAGLADWLGRTWLSHGRLLTATEVVESLDRVTLDETRAAGAAMLATAEAFAAVGPKAEALAA